GPCTPHNTPTATPARLTLKGFRLLRVRSPLLPESLLFSLPAGTEMFHFPAFPPRTLYIQARVTTLDGGGVSPFGHPRINARLSAPRGLSQIYTSFIGSCCQGIHHALSHTHHPIRASSMCARNVSNTLVFDDKKITLHKQHKNVVDARVHYTILKPLPNTTQEPTASAASTRPGWSCWLKPHP